MGCAIIGKLQPAARGVVKPFLSSYGAAVEGSLQGKALDPTEV